MNARITPEHFDRIYLEDVIPALERDPELGFQPKDETKEYLNKGMCPSCGKRSVFVKKEKPYQLKCNRLNNCGYEERTRNRYQHLFENLSASPSTPENPNATADAYLSRARGFDISKLQGWYTQGRRQMKPSGEWADTVRFPLCDGYWERIIDARAIASNEDQKAGIKAGMKYTNSGWVPPGQTIEKYDRVYIVEGIFHAIALHLAGFKAIARSAA